MLSHDIVQNCKGIILFKCKLLKMKTNILIRMDKSWFPNMPHWGLQANLGLQCRRVQNLQIVNAGEGAEKKEPSYTVGENVNWYSHYGEQYGGSLKKVKMELPYDPAIPLLGIYLEKTIIWKDTCTPMFIAALFAIVRTWKEPKCPSTEDWIKKMWYIYTMECYLAIKKNKRMPFAATWMDLEILSYWVK